MPNTALLNFALMLLPVVNSAGNLQSRNPYYGGFAIPGTADQGAVNGCPANTLTCADQDHNLVGCCPEFTFCGPYQLGSYCCPTAEDCGPVVNAEPTCADPAWTLYEDAFLWCCRNDSIGLALGDGECLPNTNTYTNLASVVVQANTASPPSTWPSGIVPSGLSTNNPSAAATTTTGTPSSVATPNASNTEATTSSSTSAASSSTSTSKPSSASNFGYSVALGALGFACFFLGAVLL